VVEDEQRAFDKVLQQETIYKMKIIHWTKWHFTKKNTL
jgi:hypothetical protein